MRGYLVAYRSQYVIPLLDPSCPDNASPKVIPAYMKLIVHEVVAFMRRVGESCPLGSPDEKGRDRGTHRSHVSGHDRQIKSVSSCLCQRINQVSQFLA